MDTTPAMTHGGPIRNEGGSAKCRATAEKAARMAGQRGSGRSMLARSVIATAYGAIHAPASTTARQCVGASRQEIVVFLVPFHVGANEPAGRNDFQVVPTCILERGAVAPPFERSGHFGAHEVERVALLRVLEKSDPVVGSNLELAGRFVLGGGWGVWHDRG